MSKGLTHWNRQSTHSNLGPSQPFEDWRSRSRNQQPVIRFERECKGENVLEDHHASKGFNRNTTYHC
jgi:hypothetical protein